MIGMRWRLAFVLWCLLLAAGARAQTSVGGGIGSVYRPLLAFTRAEKLKRGINASEWFAQVYDKPGYTPEHFQAWTTPDDIALIKAMGFDHVRLGVNPEPMMDAREPQLLQPQMLTSLDAAVKMILNQGLSVVIDLHPESDFKAKLAKDDDFVERFADFWRSLAAHYSTLDADRVFFEIMNEPEFSDRYRWLGVQMKLAAAIREGAPGQTIIAAGARWSNNDELVFQEPLHDSNIIYNFHFYEPHVFTHQGATWSSYYLHWLRGVRYPSSHESADRAAALVQDAMDRLQVIRYGRDHWDAERIESEMQQAGVWARRRAVPLVCNEFGVYREYADPADRAAWLHDVRAALEKNGIGWTLWDYSGSFGVVTKRDGKASVDEVMLKALGLK